MPGFPILNRHNSRILFIDGFCGPGEYTDGEPGSPIIALDAAREHRGRLSGEVIFLFVDSEPTRITHLNNLLVNYEIPAAFKVHTSCGEFENELTEILDSVDEQGAVLAPTFAFIDPFGFSGMPFELVSRIISSPKCEVFLNLPVQFINRFITHPNDSIREQIVRCFGTDEILQIEEAEGDRIDYRRLLYQSQLKQHAQFVRFFEMRDAGNVPLYYLFFASNHSLGHVKMKEAMWSAAPDGEYRFSDKTDPFSIALFEADCTPSVALLLQEQLCGETHVSCLALRHYVEDSTPYLSKHMKAALRQLELNDSITVEPVKMGGENRRRGSFPDDVVVSFKS
jgi:three-Cys-motif partner protein